MRLLKDEEIKLADRFLVNKWLFPKINEHFRLVQGDLFVIMRTTFYENFKALHLNLNKQRASEKNASLFLFE